MLLSFPDNSGWLWFFPLLLAPILQAQPAVEKLLPAGAKVIEVADVTSVARKPRTLVLWMEHPREETGGSWNCGSRVDGDFYVGPLRLSLVDSTASSLVNTITILGRGEQGDASTDEFWIPARVSNEFYEVPHPAADGTGSPKILRLRDLTGEGLAADFVLSQYDGCGVASAGVLGYDPRTGLAAQYAIEVHDFGRPRMAFWIPQVFGRKPDSAGRWRFTWERPGASEILHEDVTFDRTRRMFVEKQSRQWVRK